jgi:hypothetical protein
MDPNHAVEILLQLAMAEIGLSALVITLRPNLAEGPRLSWLYFCIFSWCLGTLILCLLAFALGAFAVPEEIRWTICLFAVGCHMVFHGFISISWDTKLHKRGYDLRGGKHDAAISIDWQVHLGGAIIIGIAVVALIAASSFPTIGAFFSLVSLELILGL